MKSAFKLFLILFFCFSSTVQAQTIPVYFDDFDSLSYWQEQPWGSLGSAWQLGTPNYGSTSTAHSGTSCWDVNLDSAYGNDAYTMLVSPYFSFSNDSNLFLGFFINYNTEPDSDGTRLEYSFDGGVSWEILGDTNTQSGINWYNSILYSGLPGWSGNSNGWQFVFLPPSPAFNLQLNLLQFRFVFESSFTVVGDGVSIDDFMIFKLDTGIFNVVPEPVCTSLPYQSLITVMDTVTGFNNGDTAIVHIYFGDGTDTIINTIINNNMYQAFAPHDYQFLGQYSLNAIIGLPNGSSDTITNTNGPIVVDTCARITGHAFFDLNTDCLFTAGIDSNISGLQVQLTDTATGNIHYTITDSSGDYQFTLNAAASNVILSLDTILPVLTCPTPPVYYIPSLPSVNNNFGIQDSSFDFLTYCSINNVSPGYSAKVSVFIKNWSYVAKPANVKLVLPSQLQYLFSVPIPADSVIGDTVYYSLSSVKPLSTIRLQVYLHADSTLTIGDTICVSSIAEPITSDVNPLNNFFTVCDPILSSYDPNSKEVNPNGVIPNDTTLSYTINFQNTGTAAAHKVVVSDTLSNNLDISTFQFVASSHPVHLETYQNRILRFVFDNIILPDSNSNEPQSHGFVSFNIKPKANLTGGTMIGNHAAIYFDWNLPIFTNSTVNYIDVVSSVHSVSNVSNEIVKIFPNPFQNTLTLSLNKAYGSEHLNLEILNVLGQTLVNKKNIADNEIIELKNFQNGFYLYRISSENGMILQSGKLIKQ